MNKYTFMVLFGFVLWIGETWYFGWNEEAGSALERIIDTMSWLFIAWGFIGDITTNLKIIKNEYIKAPEAVVRFCNHDEEPIIDLSKKANKKKEA